MLLHELNDARCPYRILQINHVGNAAILLCCKQQISHQLLLFTPPSSFIHVTIFFYSRHHHVRGNRVIIIVVSHDSWSRNCKSLICFLQCSFHGTLYCHEISALQSQSLNTLFHEWTEGNQGMKSSFSLHKPP